MRRWHRLPAAIIVLSLAAWILWIGTPSPAMAEVSTFHCRGAILGNGKVGDERLEHFDDEHGHDVELWCVRGVFAAHFDVRIGWNEPVKAVNATDPTGKATHRSATIAGCFFNDGRNFGPDMAHDARGAYSKIEWTNQAPPGENVTYHFSYEYGTGMVTISVVTPCHPVISKTVAPQDNIDRLEALLPDPPGGSCRSPSQTDNMAAGG